MFVDVKKICLYIMSQPLPPPPLIPVANNNNHFQDFYNQLLTAVDFTTNEPLSDLKKYNLIMDPENGLIDTQKKTIINLLNLQQFYPPNTVGGKSRKARKSKKANKKSKRKSKKAKKSKKSKKSKKAK